jgi:DNA-binding CsgD family transcriptional regulator
VDQEASPVLVDALAGRAYLLVATNCVGEGTEDAHRAVALARKIGHPAGEAVAWQALSMGAYYAGDLADAVACARQAQRIDPAGLPGWIARLSNDHLMVALLASGDVSSAWQRCADGLVLARHAGDLVSQTYCLGHLAYMDWLAGRIPEGWAHLRESTQIAARVGHPLAILNCEDLGGHLCAAGRRWAEAITLWAALDAHTQNGGFIDVPQDVDRRQAPRRKARKALGPARTRAAEQRGAAMTLAAAAEFVTVLATAEPPAPARQGQLSPRERELVTLVAQGHTDAQIASHLYISVRTVRSHLDRIRDKTGCRRRADLTRLALHAPGGRTRERVIGGTRRWGR